ncbi:MAG: TlpA disulfide reductase family protein [Candidatus Omnitrophota bacterium]
MKRAFRIFLAVIIFSMSVLMLESYALDTAPDFNLKDLNNNAVILNQFKNKQPVILIFWTTWCPFCRDQLEALKNKYAQLKQDGVEVFAVDVGERQDTVVSFIKDRDFPFSILLDQYTSVAKSFDVFGVPTYVLIDKTGAIALKDNKFPDYRGVFGIINTSEDGR